MASPESGTFGRLVTLGERVCHDKAHMPQPMACTGAAYIPSRIPQGARLASN
jgi:hypothetical protein